MSFDAYFDIGRIAPLPVSLCEPMSQRPPAPIDDTALFLIMLLGTMVAVVTAQQYKQRTLPEPMMQFIQGVILGGGSLPPALD